MISIGENKASLCKGDFHPAALYKGDKKIAGYAVEEFEGAGGVVLENCYNDKIYEAQIHSKNLLDVNSVYPDYVNENGGITYKNSNLWVIYSTSMLSEYKENTQYTFTADYEITGNEGTSVYLYVDYTDGTATGFWNSMGGIFTGDKSGKIKVTTSSGKTVKKMVLGYSYTCKVNVSLTNMMLVEGATDEEYEPPLTYATITARGKNILDMSKQTVSQGYYNDGGGTINSSNNNLIRISPIAVKPSTKYTISIGTVNSNLVLYTVWFHYGPHETHGISKIGTGKTLKVTFTTPENCKYICVSMNSSSGAKPTDLKWAMLEKGKGDGIYEPYIEQQKIAFENEELTADIPTFKGTTVIEIESDIAATISGKYKRTEE